MSCAGGAPPPSALSQEGKSGGIVPEATAEDYLGLELQTSKRAKLRSLVRSGNVRNVQSIATSFVASLMQRPEQAPQATACTLCG